MGATVFHPKDSATFIRSRDGGSAGFGISRNSINIKLNFKIESNFPKRHLRAHRRLHEQNSLSLALLEQVQNRPEGATKTPPTDSRTSSVPRP